MFQITIVTVLGILNKQIKQYITQIFFQSNETYNFETVLHQFFLLNKSILFSFYDDDDYP